MKGPDQDPLIDRLLEPAVLREQIHAAVAVDVSSTVAVRVAKILGVVLGRPRRDRMEVCLAERVGPVDLGELLLLVIRPARPSLAEVPLADLSLGQTRTEESHHRRSTPCQQ